MTKQTPPTERLPLDEGPEDDLDRLFQRAEVAPPRPADVSAGARARLRTIRGTRRLTLLALLDGVALVALAVCAFLIGQAIVVSDIPAVLYLALDDFSLAVTARTELTRAVAQAIPWPLVAAASINGLLLMLLTHRLLRGSDRLTAARRLDERA